jgi:hypothetical protein
VVAAIITTSIRPQPVHQSAAPDSVQPVPAGSARTAGGPGRRMCAIAMPARVSAVARAARCRSAAGPSAMASGRSPVSGPRESACGNRCWVVRNQVAPQPPLICSTTSASTSTSAP